MSRDRKRVFLDVGANVGQTLRAVLPERYAFDEIHCFEPARPCWPKLITVTADPRVRLHPFGLWNRNTDDALLYAPGSKGGSLWCKDNLNPVDAARTDRCATRSASLWFAENIVDRDIVFLKLNCEGAECDVLDDLIDSGQIHKVRFMLVFFDAEKITALRDRSREVALRLEACKIFEFPRVTVGDAVDGKTHEQRIQRWLKLVDMVVANP